MSNRILLGWSALILVGSLCVSGALVSAEEKPEEGFRSLFDGKTLTGWEGNEKIFRVEEGAILAGSLQEKIPNNEFLCSQDRFGNFELRLQARLRGEGKNAGIQFRSERIPNHFEVKGYQCDMGMMQSKSIWGSLYDESRRRKFLMEGDAEKLAKLVQADEWNDITIRCAENKIQIWVNDLQTVDYEEADKEIPATGIIGLQIHGGAPAEAAYRKIRIRELE